MQDMQASLTLTARRDPALQAELARARAALGELRAETARLTAENRQALGPAVELGNVEGRVGAVLQRNAARLRELRDETVRAASARAAAIRTDLAAASATDSLAAAQTRLGAAAAGGRLAMQNVAFQVQDIAVQLQAGTSASVALGQNLPQLLGGFGTLGAVAGAAVAVLGPLAFTMLSAGAAAEETADATDRLAEATDRLIDLNRARSDLDGLREQYGAVTAALWEMIEAQREQARVEESARAAETRQSIAGLGEDIAGDSPTINTARRLLGRNALFDRDARAAANRINDAFGRLEAQRSSFLGMADAAAALRDAIVDGGGGFENLNDRAKELVKEATEAEAEFRRAAAATGEVESGLDGATQRARALTDELGRARESMAGLVSDATERLARARISIDFAGDPAGAVRAQAELVADAERERARAAAAGLDSLRARNVVLADANRKAREYVETTVEADRAERQAAAAADLIADGIARAVGQAQALVDAANRARDALAGMNRSAIQGAAESEIRLANRGDPVATASALAEYRAGVQVSQIQALDSLNIPAMMRPAVLAPDKRAAAETVRLETEAAENDQRRSQLDAADRLAARGGAAGARRGERDAERARQLVSDMEAETAAILRRMEAERQGAAAVREALVLEEQSQALRRAGLSLADLSGGAEQARAQAIAEASRALFQAQSAEEAMAEARRAFAAEVGLSYDEMAAEAERWREDTLAALAGAGAGHEEYAGQVQAVFRQRLEDAYREDLDRRTDWAAGIERAMLDITELTADMATLSEDIIRQSFQGAEDAFVDLTTTGKLQVGDLVEFSIRQFYRLAQAAALDLAGGGSGGLLGNLFSAITGIALGGASFSIGGGTSFAGFSANPASFTPGGAFPSLHEGGRRADAGTRIVDPSVFLGAPRLHGGGMRPGEYPAILLDDERVLTAAQQELTARTIDGLARLAAAPRAPSGPSGITVNVYGAQGAEKAEATARQDDQGGMTIDVFFDQVDAGMGRRIASGRGATAAAIQNRWQLAPKGAR